MRAFPLVIVAAIFLRALGVRRTTRLTERAVRGHLPNAARLRRYIVWTERAGRYVPGGNCLARSIALVWLLRGHGMPAELRIGVTDARSFEAHAWVVCEGRELTDAKGARPLTAAGRP